MAKRIKLGRTVGWAAGVGVTNWLLQRRRAGTTTDADVQVPAPAAEPDLKTEIHRLRGETVSMGGMVEWIIAVLAGRFARSKKVRPRAQWNDLKRHIKSEGLKPELIAELQDVDGYFRPRNLAAHAGILITGTAETTQIFRLSQDKRDLHVDLITMESLHEEVATARAGYEAIRAVGRTLDEHQPDVLGDTDALTKAMLLG